ncbi:MULTISPECIES: ABC transporter ATP-binding protein [unclassified Rhizobium]|uniref:ABC transporter ATP-binding protein n=1 Tax=unclassified Rhizobium TaxID=2613769 RepID=UPI000EAA78FB|nr:MULTISPECIES: ABC transporter ATP-binding protein [unclassified Rhizobium]AYG67910.1 ABC transporter ATP-binding protein [Rhizobium sp. CCGE531]AYG74300.1 ABC transporter ATP-binding protein [Rhizobium sp. CCGE532]
MSYETAIICRGVSKSYGLYNSSAQRLRSLIFGASHIKRFTALNSLDVEIKKGEFFGIIGRNGSGKSTLLQMISGIIPPTSGHIHVNGRVGAMLELGAGFNPEFTGRENARLNAQILGLSNADITAAMPEIEKFADIGDFIDRPVMTYSSGMFVRLAFAVQTAINPDILIIDEALAVGDIFFRMKCYDRLNALKANGTTVILVTHSSEDIMYYCDRALLLDHGNALFCGDPTEAVNRYYELGHMSAPTEPKEAAEWGGEEHEEIHIDGAMPTVWPIDGFTSIPPKRQTGDGKVVCTAIRMQDDSGQAKSVFRQGDTLHLLAEYRTQNDIGSPCGGFVVRTDKGVIVHGRHTAQTNAVVPRSILSGTTVRVIHELKLDVSVGEYVIDLGFSSFPPDVYARQNAIPAIELEGTAARHSVVTAAINFSVVGKTGGGYKAQPFYGLAGIPSQSHLAVAGNRSDG